MDSLCDIVKQSERDPENLKHNKFIDNKKHLLINSFNDSAYKFTWLNEYKLKFYFLISVNVFS